MLQTADALVSLIRPWEARRRWTLVWMWLPRVLIPGLVLGVVLLFWSRWQPAGLPDSWLLPLIVGGCAAGILSLLAVIWLPRPSWVRVARRFDRMLGLHDRLSTALELASGAISAEPALTQLQWQDALTSARRQQVDTALPFRTDVRAWGAVLALLVLSMLMGALPPAASAPQSPDTVRQAVETSITALEDILRDVAADPTLTDEQRDPLLEALQTQLESLRQPDVSLDEALATLNEIEARLTEAAQAVQNQLDVQQAATGQAAQALSETLAPRPPDQAPPTLQEAIEQMQAGLSQMGQQQQQESAADALEQAAQALQSSNPQAAQAMQEAADALRAGDMQAAQQALERAQQAQADAQADAQTQQAQAAQLRQNAAAADQAQREAARQGQPASTERSSAQGEEGDSSGEGEASSGSDSTDQTGREQGDGAQPGAGGSDAPRSGQQTTDSVQGQQGLGGEGAGDGAGQLNADASERLQTRGPNLERSRNDPDGRGEAEYEAVFAPRFSVQAAGTDEVELRANPDDVPLQEGDFEANPLGSAQVDYAQVFADYAEAANSALESGYIPLAMRDMVKSYFSSIAPSGR